MKGNKKFDLTDEQASILSLLIEEQQDHIKRGVWGIDTEAWIYGLVRYSYACGFKEGVISERNISHFRKRFKSKLK